MNRFLSVFLCAVLLLGLCGCGNNTTSSQVNSSSENISTDASQQTSDAVSENVSNAASSNAPSSKPTQTTSSKPTQSSNSSSKVESVSQSTSSTPTAPKPTQPVEGWDELGNILIFGDSYSAFHKQGVDDKYPYGNAPYYPNDTDDVDDLEDMWFSHLLKQTKGQIIRNDSLSGATICGTTYGQNTYNGGNGWCFSARFEKLLKQGYFNQNKVDTIFIFGGTNDVGVEQMGQLKYDGWTESDILKSLPGASYFLNKLRRNLPRQTKIYFILNDSIKTSNPTLYEAYKDYCKKWAIGFIECSTIAKANGHPTAAGMKTISDDIINFIKYNG